MWCYQLALLVLLALAVPSLAAPAPVARGQAGAGTPTSAPRSRPTSPRASTGPSSAPRASQPGRAASGDGAWAEAFVRPPPRYLHSAVWDPTNSQLLVFGGKSAYSALVLGDLWSYRPATNAWTLLQPGGVAPGRYSAHAAVWDPVNAQMLVFGSGSNMLWSYRPATNDWAQLTPTGPLPPPRSSNSAVWDASNQQMLVFGGQNGGSYLNDLWAYSPQSNSWSQLPSGWRTPPSRGDHTAVWDGTGARMLVFGGRDNNALFNDRIYSPARPSARGPEGLTAG
jgi:N-acetylneuraminic acid mutarotase